MRNRNKMAGTRNIHISYTRTDLGGALNSDAIRLTQYLRADLKAPLLVYVEDREDIPFWTELFQCIRERYSEINVTTLKEKALSGIPERDSDGNELTATGKDSLMKVIGLGANKVVAVDRDLDGIITNYHVYSGRIKSDPYVISTTYYAIENHIVSPKAINIYLRKIIGEKKDYTLEYQSILTKYNNLLDPILLLQLVCAEEHVIHGGSMPYKQKSLSMDISCINNKHDDATFQICKNKISSTRGSIVATKATEIERIKTRLVNCSKYPNALWKIVQGHTLYAFVYGYMRRIIKGVYDFKESAIYAKYGHGNEANEKIQILQEQMFAPYGDLRACTFLYAYDNPEIDYSDEGIIKIINKIKNIS